LKKIIIILISSVLLFASCSAPYEPPKCVQKKNKSVIIRWGEHNFKDNIITGYQLEMNGRLSTYSRTVTKKYVTANQKKVVDEKIEEIKYVDAKEFCQKLEMIKKILPKTQVVHIPADTCRFVEYSNPEMHVRIRGVWHDKVMMKKNTGTGNFGPLGFKIIYDALMHFTLSKEELEKLEEEDQTEQKK
jgi:hypothetical protein